MIAVLARVGVFEALIVLWPASHSFVFRGLFVRQRDQLVLTRRINHLSADDALASLRPVLVCTWAV